MPAIVVALHVIKGVVFFDFFRQRYYAIEYNSYYGELFITPDYSAEDGYFFWVWYRCYFNSAPSGNTAIYTLVGSSPYALQSGFQPNLGTTSTGDNLYAFYVYSFSTP